MAAVRGDPPVFPTVMIYPNEERLARLLRGQESLLQEVHSILEEEQKKDDILLAVVRTSQTHRENHLTGMDPARIFDVEDIRRTCIRYRLRFLPSGKFKAAIPPQALLALRHTEAMAAAPLGGFKIMAPSRLFKLEDCEADPILFVPVGGGRYYLVHQWGHEIGPVRAAITWPVRGPWHMLATVLLLAGTVAALVPTSLIALDPAMGWWGPHRMFVFFWAIMTASAATAFGWLAFFGQFSAEAWDSKHFN